MQDHNLPTDRELINALMVWHESKWELASRDLIICSNTPTTMFTMSMNFNQSILMGYGTNVGHRIAHYIFTTADVHDYHKYSTFYYLTIRRFHYNSLNLIYE